MVQPRLRRACTVACREASTSSRLPAAPQELTALRVKEEGAGAKGAAGKDGGMLKAVIDTVVGNLQLCITNVHVRYEDDVSDPGSPFACGFTLDRISAATVDELGREAFVTNNPLQVLRKVRKKGGGGCVGASTLALCLALCLHQRTDAAHSTGTRPCHGCAAALPRPRSSADALTPPLPWPACAGAAAAPGGSVLRHGRLVLGARRAVARPAAGGLGRLVHARGHDAEAGAGRDRQGPAVRAAGGHGGWVGGWVGGAPTGAGSTCCR
jgi:hypothetical protein